VEYDSIRGYGELAIALLSRCYRAAIALLSRCYRAAVEYNASI